MQQNPLTLPFPRASLFTLHRLWGTQSHTASCQLPRSPARFSANQHQHYHLYNKQAQRARLTDGSSHRTSQLCLGFMGTCKCFLSLIHSACLLLQEILLYFQGSFCSVCGLQGWNKTICPYIKLMTTSIAATHLTSKVFSSSLSFF